MFSDLVLGRRPSVHRSWCLTLAIACNWVGMFVSLAKGWFVGVPIMVAGMVVAGLASRLDAGRAFAAAPDEAPADIVDRVHARLAAAEREPAMR